jgi:hypothetical protein
VAAVGGGGQGGDPRCSRDFAAAEMVCIPENIFEDADWAWRDPIGLRTS